MLRQVVSVNRRLPKLIGTHGVGANGFNFSLRQLGGGVPEHFGKPSKYTEGTDFLGTPKDHLELVARRPLSPHVTEIDGFKAHYKMPLNAVSSILNRVTGTALSFGFIGAGAVSLFGDLSSAVACISSAGPLVLTPMKALIAFPFIYHYIGGLRHLIWDKHTVGNQAEKKSLLDRPAMEISSKIVLASSALCTMGVALL